MTFLLLIAFAAQSAAADNPAQRAADLDSQASEAAQLGKYSVAERRQKQALALWEEVARTQPVHLAPPHVNLAQIYVAQQKLREAEREFRLAMTLAAPEELNRITGLLAKVLFLAGNSNDAEKALRNSIAGLEQDPKSDRAETAAAMNDLGMVVARKGNYPEARHWMERSEEIYRTCGRAGGADFGRVLSNLAAVCARQADYRCADQRYHEALVTLEAVLGPDHTHVGMVLKDSAEVLRKLGRKSEAKAFDRRAKAILAASTDLPGRYTVDVGALR